jgi:hypothetical protein
VGFEFATAGRAAAIKEWIADYGLVFQVPWAMGSNQVVLCDPKAVAHFYARDSTVYVGSKATRKVTELMVRRGSFSRRPPSCFLYYRWDEVSFGPRTTIIEGMYLIAGHDFYINLYPFRQRRALAPGFTNAAIRSLSTIFYKSAYKVRYSDHILRLVGGCLSKPYSGQICLGRVCCEFLGWNSSDQCRRMV